MKKLTLSTIAVLIAGISFAQLSLGVQAIGNLSSAKFELKDAINPTNKMRVMPGGGIVVQYGFKKLALRTGVNFLQQGVKASGEVVNPGGANGNVEVAVKLNYLQLPVNLLYVVKAGPAQVYFGGGGYVNYAVSGNSTVTGQYQGPNGMQKFEVKDNLFQDDGADAEFKRADFGLSALAGVRLPGGLFANVGYQYSLSNSSGSGEGVYKNRGLQLSIGYFFK